MTQQIYTTPTPFSGTNISIPNSGKGYTSNMVIKGQTYQNLITTNLINQDVSYVGTNIINIGDTNNFKDNTTYTAIYTVNSAKTSEGGMTLNFNSAGAPPDVLLPITLGLNKKTFALTNSVENKLVCLYFFNQDSTANISNFIILEGDWTNKEVPNYITGIESVGEKENNKISILSHNKNLIDLKDVLQKKMINYSISEDIYKIDLHYKLYNYGLLELNKKGQYTVSCKVKLGTTTNFRIAFVYTDDTITVSNQCESSTDFITITCTSNPNKTVSYIRMDWTNIGTVFIKDMQLEEGTKVTSYEPYKQDKKEILLPIEGGLKSLPDGTCDTIEQRENGVYLVQRVGKVVLNGSDNEDWTKVGNATNHTLVYHCFNAKRIPVAPYCYPFLNNQLPYSNMKLDNIEKEGCYTAQDGNVCVSISNNKLESPDSDGFKKWLQHNNMIGYYMLEKPIEVKLDINNLNLETFKDLTCVTSENNISPIFEFKAPILGYKEINPIQLKTTQDGTEVNVYPYSTPELITFGDNETLADKINNLGNTHKHNNATVTTDGFMSKESYAKLESLTEYTHPATHPATMISQDASHRFVTDTEKNTWNAKASTNVATSSTNGLMSNTDKQKIDRISNSFDIVYDANTETIRFRFR